MSIEVNLIRGGEYLGGSIHIHMHGRHLSGSGRKGQRGSTLSGWALTYSLLTLVIYYSLHDQSAVTTIGVYHLILMFTVSLVIILHSNF